MFLKKKKSIQSITTGTLLKIEAVPDPVFADKLMGDGVAFTKHNGRISSPFTGQVSGVFPTKHAITLVNPQDGFEALIHMGLDTVGLEGKPFKISVTEGDHIKAGDLIAEMAVPDIEAAGLNPLVVLVYTNQEHPVEADAQLYGMTVGPHQEIATYK